LSIPSRFLLVVAALLLLIVAASMFFQSIDKYGAEDYLSVANY